MHSPRGGPRPLPSARRASITRRILGSVIVAFSVASSGCTETAPPPDCCCDALARPHCVALEDCESSADCPTGTRCRAVHTDVGVSCGADSVGDTPSACCAGRATGGRECHLVPGSTFLDQDVLLHGFGVRRYDLSTPVEPESPLYSWREPDEAVYTQCALFGCAPEIGADGAIANYSECVVHDQLFDHTTGSFDVSGGDRTVTEVDPSTAQEMCSPSVLPSETSPNRKITTLAVGCWFYDDTRIIGATRLARVNASLSHLPVARFDQDCRTGLPGFNCALVLSPYGTEYGTCRDVNQNPSCQGSCQKIASCRQRCVRNADCKNACPDEVTDAGMCQCERLGGEYVGVCMPASSP